jgi:hypothetical protein
MQHHQRRRPVGTLPAPTMQSLLVAGLVPLNIFFVHMFFPTIYFLPLLSGSMCT